MTRAANSDFALRRGRRSAGFSYVEVLVATVLVALVLVPAFDALIAGLKSSEVHEELTRRSFRIQSRMADLGGETFEALDAAAQVAGSPTVPSSYSDTPGSNGRRMVYLSRYDGDASPPGPDPDADYGLLWIRVTIEGSEQSLETLRAN